MKQPGEYEGPEGGERRRLSRKALNVGGVVMLGSLSRPASSFEYYLVDVSDGGVGMEVAETHAGLMRPGVRVHTHLPFRFGKEFRDVGEVVRTVPCEGGTVRAGVALQGRVPIRYPVFLELGDRGAEIWLAEGAGDRELLFRRVLKDALYLKRGILIYLEHLIPIFARGSAVRGRLNAAAAATEFERVAGELSASLDVLARAVEASEASDFRVQEAAHGWEWQELRRAVTVDFGVETLAAQYSTREVAPYLRSIRLLDHRLYTNFNTLSGLHLAV